MIGAMNRRTLEKDVSLKVAIPVMIAGVVAGGVIGFSISLFLQRPAVVSRDAGIVFPEATPRVSPPSGPPRLTPPTAPPPG